MIIREAAEADLAQVLQLYTFLHNNECPTIDTKIERIWSGFVNDPNHHLLLGFEGDSSEDKPGQNGCKAVSSCVCVVVPNLTHQQRPYALIENVITHPEFRGRGCATALLNAARDIAVQANCYKIMLMTGSKLESTLRFYERAGYNSADKTAFIQWLR